MRSILLILSHGGRRWLCPAALALAWLGMSQPAAAAVSCTASTQPTVIYATSNSSGTSPLLTTVSCTGFTATGSAITENQFALCTLPSATSNDARGVAVNANGDQYRFRLVGPSASGSQDLGSPNVRAAWGDFGTTASGGVLNGSNFANGPVFTSNSQTVRGGDYVVNMPFTVEIRTAPLANHMANCSNGTSAGIVTLSIPITIRTSGPTCSINTMENVNFGDITVNAAGRVSAMKVTSSVEVACGGADWIGTFSNGNNPSGSGTYLRRMVNGSSFLTYGFGTTSNTDAVSNFAINTTNTINYDWQDDQFQTQRISFSTFLPAQTPSSLTPGIYTDTVIFTITW
jgi:hypothetical protein